MRGGRRHLPRRGGRVVIGAPREGGDGQSRLFARDDALVVAGAAFVLEPREGGGLRWVYLEAAAPTEQDWFGSAVAIDGGVIVVGAPGQGLAVTDDRPFGEGLACIFEDVDGQWVRAACVERRVGRAHHMGAAVAVEGDTVFIGDPTDEGGGAVTLAAEPGVDDFVFVDSASAFTGGDFALEVLPGPCEAQ